MYIGTKETIIFRKDRFRIKNIVSKKLILSVPDICPIVEKQEREVK